MPRTTRSKLFFGTTLVAIILLFTQSEGGGTYLAMIESISFSSDGSRIVLTKLTGRDAQTPFKAYRMNVSRTLSWLDAADGKSLEIVSEDYKPGNSGPAFGYWRAGRTSALCLPSNDQIAISAFGGGDVTLNAGAKNSVVLPRENTAHHIACSKTGRFLATSGMDKMTVFDTKTGSVAMRIETQGLPFVFASLISFAFNESRIVFASDSGVSIWDISTSTQVATITDERDEWVNAVAVLPDDTVITCSNGGARQYDFAGRLVETIAKDGKRLCSVAADGKLFAIYGGDSLQIYGLNPIKRLQTIWFKHASSICLSPNSNVIAVGDFHGHIALFDTVTGQQQWCANPPGRYRLPFSLPAISLFVWICLAWRSYRRSNSDDHQKD